MILFYKSPSLLQALLHTSCVRVFYRAHDVIRTQKPMAIVSRSSETFRLQTHHGWLITYRKYKADIAIRWYQWKCAADMKLHLISPGNAGRSTVGAVGNLWTITAVVKRPKRPWAWGRRRSPPACWSLTCRHPAWGSGAWRRRPEEAEAPVVSVSVILNERGQHVTEVKKKFLS